MSSVAGLGPIASYSQVEGDAGHAIGGRGKGGNLRGGDDDFGVDELLVEDGVLALLVRGGDEGVALVLEPLADAQLVLSRAQKLRDLFVKGRRC